MPRSRPRSRSLKATTRKRQPRLLWCSPVESVGRRCPTLKPSSSILRANILRTPSLQSWKVLRLKNRHDFGPGPRTTLLGSKTVDLEPLTRRLLLTGTLFQ